MQLAHDVTLSKWNLLRTLASRCSAQCPWHYGEHRCLLVFIISGSWVFCPWRIPFPGPGPHSQQRRRGRVSVPTCGVGEGDLMTCKDSPNPYPSHLGILHPFHPHPGPLFIDQFYTHTRSCFTVTHFPQLSIPKRHRASLLPWLLGSESFSFWSCNAGLSWRSERKPTSGPALGSLAMSYLEGETGGSEDMFPLCR